MLNLIHNIRFDRIKKTNEHSFRKNLNNLSNSELESTASNDSIDYQLLSSNWIDLYRKQ